MGHWCSSSPFIFVPYTEYHIQYATTAQVVSLPVFILKDEMAVVFYIILHNQSDMLLSFKGIWTKYYTNLQGQRVYG